MAVSHPTARHQKPQRRSPVHAGPYAEDLYERGAHRMAVYDGPRYDDGARLYDGAGYDDGTRLYDGARYDDGTRYDHGGYEDAPYEQATYDQASYGQPTFDQASYGQPTFGQVSYEQPTFGQVSYEQASFGQGSYEQATFEQAWRERGFLERAPYGEVRYEQTRYNEAFNDDDVYQDARYAALNDEPSREAPERPAPVRRKPGAHRHARPARKRRKPVKIAAAMAGSTLLVAGAAPAAAHWWHRPAEHPTALDQENPASTTLGAQTSSRPGAPVNTLDQWAQIPIGKHVAAEARVAQRARKPIVKPPAPQPSHSPRPTATVAAAYQNPLRDVSGLVLERIDMGVDFGGSGPVFALGDGIVTNATSDSSGWPGGGWITYQLTDGPDKGLVVYLAEDVTPTVQVGQNVTSSTVIANMFNGGDGIETGWATADSSTAESQMAAAGAISGGGPFPTMVGLSFDAVLESVGVPAAPNADQAGNGLLPAGYPPVPS